MKKITLLIFVPLFLFTILLIGSVPAYAETISFNFGGTFSPGAPSPSLANVVDFGSGRFTGST